LELFDRKEPLSCNSNDDSTEHDHVFDQFAQAVCNAGVVARKEVFETWASALYIYSSFLSNDDDSGRNDIDPIKRVVDVAAGHGLLAWALLILDDEHQRGQVEPRPLTAFCLDLQMPKSAEKIQSSMIQQWPHLEQRFSYVEARLEQIVPHSSCLLASVHACGILSDILVSTAAEHEVPLAVVPCCHSRKKKVLEVASHHAKSLYDDIMNTKGGMPDLADRLDEARMVALKNAGLTVEEEFLPDIFTGKNRLIMGFPNTAQAKRSFTKVPDNQSKKPVLRRGQMPPLDNASSSIMPKARFLKGFSVPCEDTDENREIVSNLSGRAAANNRKAMMHNRHHTKSPLMDLSIWLPEDDVNLSEDALSNMVESKHDKIKCNVSKVGDVYVNPSGRRSQTFRIQYNNGSDESNVLPFDDANRMHKELYQMIPTAFPGAECR